MITSGNIIVQLKKDIFMLQTESHAIGVTLSSLVH